MNDSELKPIVEQAASLLELVFDEAMRRASERRMQQEAQPSEPESLWVEGAEAVKIMGAGYTLARLKHLGNLGEIVMDKKDPDKPNSPYIFLRSSLYEYSRRRVFQLDQQRSVGNRGSARGAQAIHRKRP
jgi:hypothetical protein